MKVHVFRLRHILADVGGDGGGNRAWFFRLNYANESAICCQVKMDPVVNVMFPGVA